MWPIAAPAAERRVALVVVAVFVVAGCAYILFTDLLLYSVVRDRGIVARIETAKGWVFVALAALLVYGVTRRLTMRLARAASTLSAVLESIGDGVLILGSDRTIAYANPASRQMLKAAGRDDLRGVGAQEFSRRFRVSYPDGRLVPPDQFVSQRVFDEPGPIRYTAVLTPPGTDEVVMSCTAAAVRSETGNPADIVVSVMHDISATEHLDRLRDELFSSVAHAIKTPVAVITSASQVAAGAAPDHVRRSMAIILRQCARIDRLVANLLVLSRLRSGTLQLHPAEVELTATVQDVVEQSGRLSRGHAICVHAAAHSRVRADPERLAMVLRNTIDAAVRSSRPHCPIDVRVTRVGDDAEVAVSYEPEPWNVEREDAAEPTFDDMNVSRYVTRMIVEAHLGTVTEQSDDRETTVRIRIPAIV